MTYGITHTGSFWAFEPWHDHLTDSKISSMLLVIICLSSCLLLRLGIRSERCVLVDRLLKHSADEIEESQTLERCHSSRVQLIFNLCGAA